MEISLLTRTEWRIYLKFLMWKMLFSLHLSQSKKWERTVFIELYENFWDVIKADLLELFDALHARHLELFKLNFGKIILLRKTKEVERIQQYWPICLLNFSFKIFTKVVMIRLNSVADLVVRLTQTTVIQGRYILDGVVTLHETVHGLHQKIWTVWGKD